MSKKDFHVTLIRAVKKHECLYNPNSNKYKKTDYKKQLWKKIGEHFGLSDEATRKKWKNLRDNYKRFMVRFVETKGQCRAHRYAGELKFLDPFIEQSPNAIPEDAEVSTELSSDDDYLCQPQNKKQKYSMKRQPDDDIENSLSELLENSGNSAAEDLKEDISKIETIETQFVSIGVENDEYVEVEDNIVEHPSNEKDSNEILIDLVKKYDCLYNILSPRYKRFRLKERLWHRIGKRLGDISAIEAKKKWKNIRDNYRKYKQKSHNDGGFNRPYKYANSLKFLDDFAFIRPFNPSQSYADSEVYTDLSSDEDGLQIASKQHQSKGSEKSLKDLSESFEPTLSTENVEGPPTFTSETTTFRLFAILANKINEANLNPMEKNDIEFAVSSVVYSKLAEFYKKNTNNSS